MRTPVLSNLEGRRVRVEGGKCEVPDHRFLRDLHEGLLGALRGRDFERGEKRR